MKEKMYALKQSAYYGALNGTLAAVLLGGIVLVFCLVSVIGSAQAGQPVNWYACVIGGIALFIIVAYLVGSQDLERAPFTESVPFYSVWLMSWVLTAAVVFIALSMVATAVTAIALAQSWYSMSMLIATGIALGITFIWCLFIHFCPEPALN